MHVSFGSQRSKIDDVFYFIGLRELHSSYELDFNLYLLQHCACRKDQRGNAVMD